MPTKFHTGQRVVHATLGQGTVVETEGDSCRVELDSDDGARIRTFMISLGTLCPVDAVLINHDASQAITPPTTPEESPMPDTLLAELDKTIASRPRGAVKGLAAELGIDGSAINYWRKCGKIPDIRREAVRTWIDAPTITAIRVEKTKPAPKAKPAKAPKPAQLRVVAKPAPAADLPPIRCAVDAGTVIKALGLTVTTAWIPDGAMMRQAQVVVIA